MKKETKLCKFYVKIRNPKEKFFTFMQIIYVCKQTLLST